jgi:hypothetical protein
MPISVHCEECGKTYQVSSKMAGRKGKCPQGHKIRVPAPIALPAPAEENEFAFESAAPSKVDDEAPASKRKASGETAPIVQPMSADEEEFAFKTTPAAADEPESPKSGRKRYNQHSKFGEAPARKSMMPLIIGGLLAIVGIAGGVAMLMMARSEIGPLREKADAAEKRANEADLNMKTAQAVANAAEQKLTELKNTPPPPDPALRDAQKKVADLERKLKDLESKAAAADAKEPAAKNAPSAPKEPKKDNAPKGGKNWTAPDTVMAELINYKTGDRLWIRPKEDATIKAMGGVLKVAFRYELRQGKQLPSEAFGTLLIVQAGEATTKTIGVAFKGPNGEAEAAFDVKGLTGKANITLFISDGNIKMGGKNLMIYSSFIATSAEF